MNNDSKQDNIAQHFHTGNDTGSRLEDIKLDKIDHDSASNDTPFMTINDESDNCLIVAQQNTLNARQS